MAIFSNGDNEFKSNKSDSNTTIITAGAKIEGSLELSCNLYIDGELEGSIISDKEVNIGKHGKIKGTIKTQRVVIQGYVEGTIEASRVEIKSLGHVKGEILYSELVIEAKGVFEGNSVIKDNSKLEVQNG